MKIIRTVLEFLSQDKIRAAGTALFAFGLILEYASSIRHIFLLPLFLLAFVAIGRNILKHTLINLSKLEIFDENFLMTAASAGAFSLGFYSEAAGVMLFYSVGEFFQDKASDNATRSIEAMLSVNAELASVETEAGVVKKDPSEVPVGSIVVVAPGEKVPLDGVVIKGASDMNTQALTGESAPRYAGVDDEVFAGFINGGGLITLRTTKDFDNTVFAKVIALVKDSHTKKSVTEKFITRFARVYTPVVCLFALMAALLPPLFFGKEFSASIYRALIFLVISCPCALLLSVPLSFYAGLGAEARNGVFVKGGEFLEALAHLKTVLFDKTGTLTTGGLKIARIEAAGGFTPDELLRYAATAELHSTHPIGKRIVEEYKTRFSDTPLERNFIEYTETPGLGVRVVTEQNTILVGRDKYISKETPLSGGDIYAAVDGRSAGSFTFTDEIRGGAEDVLRSFQEAGVKSYILSGDTLSKVRSVAEKLPIDGYFAELMPEGKVEKLGEILNAQRKGDKTAFVGDGINDAPVLARADIGIAMGGAGSDAALEAADIVLTEDNLAKIPLAVRIAKRTRVIAYENIVGAVGVKLVVMAAGLAGFASLWLAIFADVGVALLAVLNSLRILEAKSW